MDFNDMVEVAQDIAGIAAEYVKELMVNDGYELKEARNNGLQAIVMAGNMLPALLIADGITDA